MPRTETSAAEEKKGPAGLSKYLLFGLGDEQFGLDVMSVREIVELHPLTALPNSPPYLPGVINLRGRVAPVINVRLRIAMEDRDLDARTCLIVVETGPPEGRMLTALAVDAVFEVAAISDEDIEAAPNRGGREAHDYLRGLTRIEGKVTLLLDAEELARLDEEDYAAAAEEKTLA